MSDSHSNVRKRKFNRVRHCVFIESIGPEIVEAENPNLERGVKILIDGWRSVYSDCELFFHRDLRINYAPHFQADSFQPQKRAWKDLYSGVSVDGYSWQLTNYWTCTDWHSGVRILSHELSRNRCYEMSTRLLDRTPKSVYNEKVLAAVAKSINAPVCALVTKDKFNRTIVEVVPNEQQTN